MIATYSIICSFTKIPMTLSFIFISDAEQERGQGTGGLFTTKQCKLR